MTGPAERVVENLNRGLHELFAVDERVYLLGEDIADPYGGAFKVSRGLSTRFPDRVLTTPISEGAIVGVAGGLALCGQRPVVEIMFGDFITLCFDQLYNFASKSVAMYGRRVEMSLVVRCPVGGNRGYGPTHSQHPQKHFIGIPHLNLFELSPFHDSSVLLNRMLDLGEPAILFEDKILYGQRMHVGGRIDELVGFDFLDPRRDHARAFLFDQDECDCLVIAPGGLAERVLAAMRELFLAEELVCQLVVPAQLYPFDIEPLLPLLTRAGRVCVVEEGVAGGTWGAEVAASVHERLWGQLRAPVLRLNSVGAVIPAAPELERATLVQKSTVYNAIRDACRA
ncbi:MAG TPA: transketolase C-terminal domain-containing protein [Pseudonocardiaceae bacterium]|jgi:pyruvate dehydrogenase E1 component beta subunit|nr:transketolase C-terminal domain-containing protein [Pseudonocardiaceae bacterium]